MPRAYLTSARTLKDSRWTAGLRLEDFGSAPRLVKAAAGDSKGAVIWSPAFNDLTPAQVKEAQALGLRVVPWTVNQRADMARLMDWGVDGIITDDPAMLRDVMRERGLALPARGSRAERAAHTWRVARARCAPAERLRDRPAHAAPR